MDPSQWCEERKKFEADRYNEAWKTVREEIAAKGKRDYVKLYDASLRLPQSDWLLLRAAIEAERPPVSERLTASEVKAIIDRPETWVMPPKRIPSPPPRYGRAADGRKIRSPSAIRRIRADRLKREEADELDSRRAANAMMDFRGKREATARMDISGKRARPPATGGGQPITPRQALHIDGIEIRGVAWGDETSSVRRHGIMSEMRSASKVFGLSHMISSHDGTNAGTTMATLVNVVQGLVDDGNVVRFKVGITWNPPNRWANDRYGYNMNYSRMHLLLVDQSSAKCGIYEAFLIDKFAGHAKIDNVKIGDDNRQTVSPHYVYLVTQLDCA